MIILIGILALGIVAFFAAAPNVSLQLSVVIATAIAYVIWGVTHHIIQKDLHHKIVVEYILIGIIAIILLVTIGGL